VNYCRGERLSRVYLVFPTVFANHGLRSYRNTLTRLQSLRRGNGPSSLLKNALAGLQKLNTTVITNSPLLLSDRDPVWIPSGDLWLLSKMEIESLSKTKLTLGPNIDFFDLKNLEIISQFSVVNVLVPHEWVILPLGQILPQNCRIRVWHSGIDTDFWKRKKKDSNSSEVLIYLKNLTDVENFERSKDYLRELEVPYSVLSYGSYSQHQFKSILNRVNSAIWIGGTESQGLALLECWAMNVPTLVLKNEKWHSAEGKPYPASSAPYMTKGMGLFSNSTKFSLEDFNNFFSELQNFSPRKSVQEPFNLISCASTLLKILTD